MQYKAGVVRCSIFSWCSMHDIIFKRSDVFVGISLGDKVVEFGSIEEAKECSLDGALVHCSLLECCDAETYGR